MYYLFQNAKSLSRKVFLFPSASLRLCVLNLLRKNVSTPLGGVRGWSLPFGKDGLGREGWGACAQ